MREFFINSLEKIISVVIVLMAAGVITSFVVVTGARDGGIGPGLAVLVGGTIWIMIFGGMAYLGLGIYHNTRRTAEAVEDLAKRMK